MSSLKTKNNNLLALKAQQLLAEQLPGGELTVNVIKTLMKPENLKRLAVALIGGTILLRWLRNLSEKHAFRAEIRKELEKQLEPIHEKLEALEEQNEELLRQNERLQESLEEA